MTVPVVCYLVEHASGRVLFDTGIHRDTAADPARVMGVDFVRRFRPGADAPDVVASLASLGRATHDVTHVVNSHLHFDHCGCNRCFLAARTLVQAVELADAETAKRAGKSAEWDFPLDYHPIDGEHDLFGDGSVVAMPTPGHTAGHQSLVVRTGPGQCCVLVGDACYTEEHLQRQLLPPAGAVWNERYMRESLGWLRDMREKRGATILFSHDGPQWVALGTGAARPVGV
ncbi:MAG TPA: N-acyl homoserine lactonase family protein [Reyranella sp.]|nr:N-acyl homoserine lactonase family protein [Reyranella sp.]